MGHAEFMREKRDARNKAAFQKWRKNTPFTFHCPKKVTEQSLMLVGWEPCVYFYLLCII